MKKIFRIIIIGGMLSFFTPLVFALEPCAAVPQDTKDAWHGLPEKNQQNWYARFCTSSNTNPAAVTPTSVQVQSSNPTPTQTQVAQARTPGNVQVGGQSGTPGNIQVSPGSTLSANTKLQNPIKYSSFSEFAAAITKTAVQVLLPFIVLAFIYSGFLFVKAQGNEKELEEAKQAIWYSMIGAFVLLGAWGFAQIISQTVSTLTQ